VAHVNLPVHPRVHLAQDVLNPSSRDPAAPFNCCSAQPQVQLIREIFSDSNRLVRGWSKYFRTGNADNRFIQFATYIRGRLLSLCIARKGRNLQAGDVPHWTREYFECLGLYRLRETVLYPQSPFDSRVMLALNRSLVSRVREIRMHGLMGDPVSSCCLWAA
jgi:hypothetical protein